MPPIRKYQSGYEKELKKKRVAKLVNSLRGSLDRFVTRQPANLGENVDGNFSVNDAGENVNGGDIVNDVGENVNGGEIVNDVGENENGEEIVDDARENENGGENVNDDSVPARDGDSLKWPKCPISNLAQDPEKFGPALESPLIRVFQVIVLAIKNRSLSLPGSSAELYETSEKEPAFTNEKISHTEQFSFLDKAAILRKDTKAEPWKVCTVTQVEEVKVLTRMLPILFSTVIMNTCLAQLQTFSIQQGNRSMNRKLGNFEVPAPSIPVIPLIFMCILIPIYECFFVPFARKITKHPAGITQLQRVGIGLVLSAVSMAVAGIVEVKRRHYALAHSPLSLSGISLFWLSFQYAIFGIADMFTLVGLLEFFYREAPASMKSLSTSFTWLSLSFGYFLSSIFVDIINAVTARIAPSKLGWLHGMDINQNNVNLFFFFLAILSCLNFANYLYWASWYKYKTEEPDTKVQLKEVEKAPLTENENGSKATTEEVSSVQTEENKEKVASV